MEDRHMFVRSVPLGPLNEDKMTETPVPIHNGETIIGIAVEGHFVHILVLYSQAAALRHAPRQYDYDGCRPTAGGGR